uniref:Uncharacterized protein n=1 Tax=Arundo donax TaxID=35708 RepID=A0A0A8XSB2_ARUDO
MYGCHIHTCLIFFYKKTRVVLTHFTFLFVLEQPG